MKRGYLSNWPSWLPRSSPCVFAGRGQWARARKLLARDDEGSTTCVIVSRPGAVVGVVTLDGRDAWVRGELVQPRRPGSGGWAKRVKPYKQQTISLPPRSSVPIVRDAGSAPHCQQREIKVAGDPHLWEGQTMNEPVSETICGGCRKSVSEVCQDERCRACHVSCSWEDCTDGSYSATAMRRLGHSEEKITAMYPNAKRRNVEL